MPQSLATMFREAREASERFAREEKMHGGMVAHLEHRARAVPLRAHRFLREAVEEVSGHVHRLPSGPLHDAAEVARAGIPTVMMFVQSLGGISHNKIEDTREEHLELAVEALGRLATKTVGWILNPIDRQ